ncbi:hypothetical protein [Sphingobium chlorophenolicum]|nr:hypothetical protein [Sphingobium chlorophenolicum]
MRTLWTIACPPRVQLPNVSLRKMLMAGPSPERLAVRYGMPPDLGWP